MAVPDCGAFDAVAETCTRLISAIRCSTTQFVNQSSHNQSQPGQNRRHPLLNHSDCEPILTQPDTNADAPSRRQGVTRRAVPDGMGRQAWRASQRWQNQQAQRISEPVSVGQYVLMARSMVRAMPAITAAMRMMRAGIFRVIGGAM